MGADRLTREYAHHPRTGDAWTAGCSLSLPPPGIRHRMPFFLDSENARMTSRPEGQQIEIDTDDMDDDQEVSVLVHFQIDSMEDIAELEELLRILGPDPQP